MITQQKREPGNKYFDFVNFAMKAEYLSISLAILSHSQRDAQLRG